MQITLSRGEEHPPLVLSLPVLGRWHVKVGAAVAFGLLLIWLSASCGGPSGAAAALPAAGAAPSPAVTVTVLAQQRAASPIAPSATAPAYVAVEAPTATPQVQTPEPIPPVTDPAPTQAPADHSTLGRVKSFLSRAWRWIAAIIGFPS